MAGEELIKSVNHESGVDNLTLVLLVFSGLAAIAGIGVLTSAVLSLWRRGKFIIQFAHGAHSVTCQRNTMRVMDIEVIFQGRAGVETKTIFFYFPHLLRPTSPNMKGQPPLLVAAISAGRFSDHDYFSVQNFSFLPEEALRVTVTLTMPDTGGHYKVICSVHPVLGVPKIHELSIEVV